MTTTSPSYEQAINGTLDWSNVTAEMLNEKNKLESTLFHYAANNDKLKEIPVHLFTSEALSQKDISSITVWHTAAWFKTLKDIPKDLFTSEAIAQKDAFSDTVWHQAAHAGVLNAIPKQFFTIEALNIKNKYGNTVWHSAAISGSLKYIPSHLFTNEILSQTNSNDESVWELAQRNNTIQDIPLPLITKDLLEMKNKKGESLFTEKSIWYINSVINSIQNFTERYPELEDDIKNRDPRYKLSGFNNCNLYFKFDGIDDTVSISRKGVFLNNEDHKTLSDTAIFIANNYPGIEESIVLPVSAFPIEEFVL